MSYFQKIKDLKQFTRNNLMNNSLFFNDNIIFKEYNGKKIRIREDRYVNLTDMANATGKKVNDWYRLKSTDEYLKAFNELTGITADQLIQINESSGANELRGTYGHPKVAIRFAQWCSPHLEFFMTQYYSDLEKQEKSNTLVDLNQNNNINNNLMNNFLFFKEYKQNKIAFDLTNQDIMINFTEMCKVFGKHPNDFLSLKQTELFLIELSKSLNLSTTGVDGSEQIQAVITVNGGSHPGTWIHRKLAIKAAAWLSPEFELWMTEQLINLESMSKLNEYLNNNRNNDLSDDSRIIRVFKDEKFGYMKVIRFNSNDYFDPDAVVNALGYKDADSMYDTFKNIPEEDKGLYIKHFTFKELSQLRFQTGVEQNKQLKFSPNGKRFLTEAGLFYILNRSDKPNAYPFQRYVNTVILPEIRKNGYYINPAITNQQLQQLQSTVEDLNKKLLEKDKLITKQRERIKMLHSNPRFEKTYQAWLHSIVGGEREVRVGLHYSDKRKQKRIDIVTEKYIFECKNVKDWEKSITQINKYKLLMKKDGNYNNQNMIVFLFDDNEEYDSEIDFIREVAKQSNVSVFYYKNMAGYVDADELENCDDND
jgi:prophage antirepressor-like protein